MKILLFSGKRWLLRMIFVTGAFFALVPSSTVGEEFFLVNRTNAIPGGTPVSVVPRFGITNVAGIRVRNEVEDAQPIRIWLPIASTIWQLYADKALWAGATYHVAFHTNAASFAATPLTGQANFRWAPTNDLVSVTEKASGQYDVVLRWEAPAVIPTGDLIMAFAIEGEGEPQLLELAQPAASLLSGSPEPADLTYTWDKRAKKAAVLPFDAARLGRPTSGKFSLSVLARGNETVPAMSLAVVEGKVVLSWAGPAGQGWRIEVSQALPGGWEPLVSLTNGQTSLEVPNIGPAGFFRLVR
jgi:hypothetical protein